MRYAKIKKGPLDVRKAIETIQNIMLGKNVDIPKTSVQLKKEMERRQPDRTPEQWSESGDGPTNPPVAEACTSDGSIKKSNHSEGPMCITQEDGPEPSIEDHSKGLYK